MSSSTTHPRRRPASPSSCAALIDSFAGLCLKKGTTFHSPTTNKSDLFNPLTTASPLRSMTGRSSTSPKDLEELLIGAGERRAADLLARVDEAIANNTSAVALGKLLSEPEALPNPRCVLENTTLEDIPEEGRENNNNAYDSGLGSSIADSDEFDTKKTETLTKGSDRALCSVSHDDHLSDFALEQIHNFIIKPILAEEALQDFHPLIKAVPRRIGAREITTLRDLEKTLIFLAPDYSRSPTAYLDFCETYIDCLHATVDAVHESDHCSPSDRPYTNNYFFDLVAQIRRYAQIVAITRSKQERGEELDEMDVTSDERISLRGGMTHDGTPAQLVRSQNGKDISIATGQFLSPTSASDHSAISSKRPVFPEGTFDASATMPSKRAISEDAVDDDGAERSMARRRKGEPVKTYVCTSEGCTKTFRRPCDRTKHMKGHERPWKCPHTDCKFHEEGWPTEKECERHVNDKHAAAPTMYACHWRNVNNCPYMSKRLSNCKSHMEKAHNWQYVRSKTTKNGKAKVIAGVAEPSQQPIRIVGGVVAAAAASTPSSSSSSATPAMQNASLPFSYSSSSSSRHGSSVPSSTSYTNNLTPFESPALPMAMEFDPQFTSHFNFNFNVDRYGFTPVQFPYTPSLVDDRRLSHGSSAAGTAPNSALMQAENSFEDAFANPLTPEDSPYNPMLDGFKYPQNSNMDMGTYTNQDAYTYQDVYTSQNAYTNQDAMSHMISPPVQPVNANDPTLTMTQPLADEGFGDTSMDNDFELSSYLPGRYNNNESLFPESSQNLFSDNNETMLSENGHGMFPEDNQSMLPKNDQSMTSNSNIDQSIISNSNQSMFPANNQTVFSDTNQALYQNNNEFALGTQFDEPAKDKNPYSIYFPELDEDLN